MFCGVCSRKRVRGEKGDDFKLRKCPDCHRWSCKSCTVGNICKECFTKELCKEDYVIKHIQKVKYETC